MHTKLIATLLMRAGKPNQTSQAIASQTWQVPVVAAFFNLIFGSVHFTQQPNLDG